MVQSDVVFFQPIPPNTPLTPIIVQVVDAPAKEIGVIDILMGSLGITGILLLGSALFGVLVAGVIFWIRRRLATATDGTSLASAQLNLTPPVTHQR